MRQALTYDDIQLVPAFSNVTSRKTISLVTNVTRNYKLHIPIIAAPMDTVCEYEMASALMKLGGVGCIHRFMSIEEQVGIVKKLKSNIDTTLLAKWGDLYDDYHAPNKFVPIMVAVGATGDYIERTNELIKAGANIILIDVAHGHHENVKMAIQNIKAISSEVDVIAGNIATPGAAIDLCDWGADALRVGVGGGSLCTTRIKTGFGVPNVTCLQDIIAVSKVPVIADGGIRTSGDISKALALGADTVMLGSLIAGTEEAPGSIIDKNGALYKRYRGAASLETKMAHGQEARNVEGESTVIPYKGGVKYIVTDLLDGVRSALSYGGANELCKFNPQIVQVTNSGLNEANPHLIK
jgi:IMP dehydrogenase